MSAQRKPAWRQRLGRVVAGNNTEWEQLRGEAAAIRHSMAVIEFDLSGRVLDANPLFLEAFGYRRDEVLGQHHRMFVDPAEASSPAYQAFWKQLSRGEFSDGQFRRIDKHGRDVWIQATYQPIHDALGAPCKVVKFASVITGQREHDADLEGQLQAIGKSMAIIEFDLKGNILHANSNFLAAMGYSSGEVIGQHHRMFVERSVADSDAYRQFWEKLGRGEYDSGQYQRIGKGGREVWIEASYNPVLDAAGRPYKVVKFATDITERRQRDADVHCQLQAIHRAMAVIEFDLDGRVLDANPQFLSAMGYRIEEIRGKHHRQFVLPGEAESAAYAEFWKRLAQGSVESGRYRRRAKDGSEIWLQASYNPVLDAAGRPYKVVKFATNITPALRSMMSEIAELAEQIKSASGEIAAGNGDLASRTEAQAASIEETAASMEQLIGTVRQTAANADQARRLAGDATEAAGRGSGVVRSVVDSMHEIDGASRRIADIIGLIDGIAFQTNILALNAAVEAARAGEQGRGFAVVASEVRALAQRSAEAAKDIKGLIGDSSRSVKEGTHRAETAGTAMQAILDSVDKVGGLLSEVASATAEQTSGIEQVNQAIAHIDEGTQQNAALVEQASAASRLLDEQARALNQTVAHFLA